jgi:hypothetical protein
MLPKKMSVIYRNFPKPSKAVLSFEAKRKF